MKSHGSNQEMKCNRSVLGKARGGGGGGGGGR